MLSPEQYYSKKILPQLLQGLCKTESQDITRILRRSPAIQNFFDGKPRQTSYNALIQNLGTVSWSSAMKLYNHLFLAKNADSPPQSISKPNLQTARVVLNVLFRSANWQLVTKHFTKYCFEKFKADEAAYNLGKLYTYLQDQRVSEMAYKLLEHVERDDVKYTEDLRNTLFRTDLVTWNANLRILSILYRNNKRLISENQIHQVLMLCVRSLQWKKCMQVLLLSEELNVKVSSSLLLRVAKLFFKGNRWSLSSHILNNYRVNSSVVTNTSSEVRNLSPVERRDQANMLALARMWTSALQLVQKESVEDITDVLRMAGAWECAMRYCCSIPCMHVNTDPIEKSILKIPWKVVQNCILAGKQNPSARTSSLTLLRPFFYNSPSVACWKLALQISNVNFIEIIRRLPVESQLLDMKFFPITHHIHSSHRFKVLFPLVLNYLEETGVISHQEREKYDHTFYPQRFNGRGFSPIPMQDRWMFAFAVLHHLTSQPDKAPVHRPTFNQLMVTLSHLTNIPYLTVIKGPIDALKLNRQSQAPNTESMLKSFVYGGYLGYAFDLINRLREWNLTISVECLVFAVSTMVLPGITAGEQNSLEEVLSTRCLENSGGDRTIAIPVNIRNPFEHKMLNDYIKMYRFIDLIHISAPHKALFMGSHRFPIIVHAELQLKSILTLQSRTGSHHPDVLILYNSSDTAVIFKPPKLESIAHAASRCPADRCPDLTSAILHLFPEARHVRSFGLAHRLDIQTSGVLIVAKSQPAFHHITQQSLTRQKRKCYLCLCIQVDPEKAIPDRGTISTGFSDMRDDSHRMSLEGDAEAETHYTMVRKFACSPMCLVECRLVTGRQHQIRVHLGQIGLLLLGDDRYGCGLASSPLIDRVALHAKEIGFWEPSGDGFCVVEVTAPSDIASAIARLECMDSAETNLHL